MDKTFNFERDHPELYAEVQAEKAKQRRITIIAYIVSVSISLIILALLIDNDVEDVSLIIIQSWVALTTSYTIGNVLRSVWK